MHRDVALTYASHAGGYGSAVVFELQQGMIDRGADISWLSQYPAESEVRIKTPRPSQQMLQKDFET